LVRFKTLLGLNRPEESPRRFTDDAAEYRARLEGFRDCLRPNGSGARIAFLVTPWMRTAVPFFSLECARLAATHGLRPILIWDRTNVAHNAETPQELHALQGMIDLLRGVAEIVEPSEPEPDVVAPEDLLFESFVRYARGEQLAYLPSPGRVREFGRKWAGVGKRNDPRQDGFGEAGHGVHIKAAVAKFEPEFLS
jgi:hypothetical protein